MMDRFPAGTRLIVDVVFTAEYRIGWEYRGVSYFPGFASYYELSVALDKAWDALCQHFPDLKDQQE